MPAEEKVKKPAKPAEHPPFKVMVVAAIGALKERNGSSRQAIEKYIKANYKVGDNVSTQLKLTLRKASEKGVVLHSKGKGASGSFKLPKKVPGEKKPKVVKKKPAVKKPVAKKPAAKAAAKKSSAKKAAKKSPKKPKKPATKKSTPKKAAAKPAKKAATKKPAAKKTAKKPATKKAKK